MTARRGVRGLSRRVREVGWKQVLLIGRALGYLLAARIALRVVPMTRILGWQQRPLGVRARGTEEETREYRRRVRQAVLVAVRYAPVNFVCFPQCLAASALLRRRGLATRLHYGVTRLESGLMAHTWLESGGEVVLGGETSGQYSTLGIYESV